MIDLTLAVLLLGLWIGLFIVAIFAPIIIFIFIIGYFRKGNRNAKRQGKGEIYRVIRNK